MRRRTPTVRRGKLTLSGAQVFMPQSPLSMVLEIMPYKVHPAKQSHKQTNKHPVYDQGVSFRLDRAQAASLAPSSADRTARTTMPPPPSSDVPSTARYSQRCRSLGLSIPPSRPKRITGPAAAAARCGAEQAAALALPCAPRLAVTQARQASSRRALLSAPSRAGPHRPTMHRVAANAHRRRPGGQAGG
jgi:hypothetical protein